MNPRWHTEQMFKPGDTVKAAQYSLLEEYMLYENLNTSTVFTVEYFDAIGRIKVCVPDHLLSSPSWVKWGRIDGTLWERGNFTKVELPRKRSLKYTTHISVANTPSTAAGWVYESPQHKIKPTVTPKPWHWHEFGVNIDNDAYYGLMSSFECIVCDICGALIYNPQQHTNWHQNQGDTK